MLDFYRTPAGRTFFEKTLPQLTEAINNLAKELKRSNDLAEKGPSPEAKAQSSPDGTDRR